MVFAGLCAISCGSDVFSEYLSIRLFLAPKLVILNPFWCMADQNHSGWVGNLMRLNCCMAVFSWFGDERMVLSIF